MAEVQFVVMALLVWYAGTALGRVLGDWLYGRWSRK